MSDAIVWYLLVTIFGLLAWPLAFRLLPGLPERGYTLSRALGLLLTGYVFWLLGSLGLLHNTAGGVLFSLLIVAGLSLWAYATRPDKADSLLNWLKDHIRLVITSEALFLLAFAGWAVVRAYNPDISGTEKPMDLAFLNGIRASRSFPPHDPWLSGYAISYYYFGYLIVAMLSRLGGIPGEVAFNLAIALLFALTLLGSYGVVYNLIAASAEGDDRPRGVAFGALLGPIFVGVMGNLEGFFELLRALNLPFLDSGFWRWLDIADLNEPLPGGALWPPDRWRFWWWWRASRVIHERTIAGESFWYQPIDEFPFFSFLLGDMHPHVLVLPFVLLALGLAFNLLAQRGRITRAQVALYTVCIGGLAFLNTWDLPTYLFIVVGALLIRRIRERGVFDLSDVGQPLLLGLLILVLGLVAYLPWYISFSSQAGGILPNAVFATRLHQFLVMFGPFVVIIAWFLVDEAIRNRARMGWSDGLLLGAGVLAGLIGLMVALSVAALRLDPAVAGFLLTVTGFPTTGLSQEALQSQLPAAIGAVIRHRLTHPLTPLLLTGLIGLTLSRLLPRPTVDGEESDRSPAFSASTGFALLLILTGALLTLGPEFVYLRDVFGQRMNTIFKFYYAAWVLFGVAAAYAAHRLARRPLFAPVLAVLVLAALVYPVIAIPTRMGEGGRLASEAGPTLDGLDYIRRQHPQDYQAIMWLRQVADPEAVIVEAVGGQYSYYARVSATTGLQTVLGWPGHERQWRGDLYPALAGSREEDVREIYNTPSMPRALELLERYGVTYLYVGPLERDPAYASPAGIEKFDRYLTAVYRNEGVTIYRVDLPLIEEQQP